MNKKKLSDEEFIRLVINKELEIAGANTDFDTLVESKDKDWYDRYSFKTMDQYNEWKDFFFTHFYDWKPKRYAKKDIEREFGYWNLMWGLRCDFDILEIHS